MDWRSLDNFGMSAEVSEAGGKLNLPELPPGNMSVWVVHKQFAPTELKAVKVGRRMR